MKLWKYIFVLMFCGGTALAQPQARQGVLDLRELNFSGEDRDVLVPLNGEWEFYWKRIYNSAHFTDDRLLKKPDFINYTTRWSDLPQLEEDHNQFGYATMRLQLIVGDDLPSMSLYLPIVYSAYDLYVNGEGFEGNGIVGSSKANSLPYWRPSSKVVELKPGVNELIVHISNFRHHKGGAIEPILLATSDQINFFRNFKISSTLFLAGCLLIAGALAFGFYWFNPTDYTGLFFFAFCAAYLYRLLGTDQYVIHAALRGVPWSLTLRLEYISLFASVSAYAYFIRNLIQPRVPIWTFHGLAIVSGLMTISAIVLPTWIFTAFMDYYLVLLIGTMMVVGLIYMGHINFTHKTSYVTTAGALMLFVVAGEKILEHFGLITENLYVTTICYVGFIFSMAVAMTIRFGRNFRESSAAARIAAQTKDQFLNTMSHELRTPMNAILGMTDILENSTLKTEQREKLQTIKRNGESLLAIIMDILSLTDVEARKVVLEKQDINIEDCIEGAYNLAARHRRVKVEFVKNIDKNIPAHLIGDSLRIKQVLMHLLSNAFKFTEEGVVTLDVDLLDKEKGKVDLRFSIEDTGIGIEPSLQENIFQAFSQADASNSRRFGGVGLGLTVVEQMVVLMGGKIEMESEKGKGTRFWFNISLEVGAVIEEEKLRPTEIDKKLRILYAEDNPVNQKLLTMMLKTMGLEIDIAANGREAWEMACENQYHIILMDIQMPEMDGIEASRKIIEDVELRPIIIAVTANATISDKKKCFEAGMNDFLTKPIKANDLKEGILKWQSLRKYLDESNEKGGRYIQLSS